MFWLMSQWLVWASCGTFSAAWGILGLLRIWVFIVGLLCLFSFLCFCFSVYSLPISPILLHVFPQLLPHLILIVSHFPSLVLPLCFVIFSPFVHCASSQLRLSSMLFCIRFGVFAAQSALLFCKQMSCFFDSLDLLAPCFLWNHNNNII